MAVCRIVEDEEKRITFRDEMLQQPIVLRNFIKYAYEDVDAYQAFKRLLQEKKNPHFVFTGMGSSLFACYITMKYLQSKGIRASVVESLELQSIHKDFLGEDAILIAVSQSGESPEVIELLSKISPDIAVISVTNRPSSRLHNMAEISFCVYAGAEYYTSTKTYTNTLAGMILLAYRLTNSKDELQDLRLHLEVCCDKMETLLSNEAIGKEIAEFLVDVEFAVCVGSGYSYTTACHSELVMEEAGKFYASCYTPAQFVHGPIELIKAGFCVVIYDFDPDYYQKCDVVRESVLNYGGKVLLITNRSDIEARDKQYICKIEHEDPLTSVLLEIIPLELGIDSLCTMRGVATGQLSRVVKR